MLQAVDYGEDADLEPEDAAMAEQDGAEAEAAVGQAAVAGEGAEAALASDAAQAAVAEPSAAAPVPAEAATGAAGETVAAEAALSGEQATHSNPMLSLRCSQPRSHKTAGCHSVAISHKCCAWQAAAPAATNGTAAPAAACAPRYL